MKKIICAYVLFSILSIFAMTFVVSILVQELPKAVGEIAAETQKSYEAAKNKKE